MFAWLFIAFWAADHSGAFFVTSPVIRALSAVIMLVAFWHAAGALIRKPPILLTAETALQYPNAVFGIVRITRHPFLWALVLWSLVHMLNNADPAGLSLFGYLFALALLGTLPIDKRRARLIDEERWRDLQKNTSNIPFGAILKGRQKIAPAIREMGLIVPLVAIAAWLLVLTLHERFFGLPVFY